MIDFRNEIKKKANNQSEAKKNTESGVRSGGNGIKAETFFKSPIYHIKEKFTDINNNHNENKSLIVQRKNKLYLYSTLVY